MKDWKRTLAALLAAIMLVMPFGATAEPELELNVPPEADAGLELEIAPESVGDVTDLELELPEGLELGEIELDDPDAGITLNENLLADGMEAEGTEAMAPNSFTDGDYNDYEFKIDTDGRLYEYNGDGGDVVIPDGVTSIGDGVFRYSSVTSVSIPGSVTSIGEEAFMDSNLKSLTIPNSVTSIGEDAFSFTDITSIVIPESITYIGKWFSGCNELTNVKIHNNVTGISGWAFCLCDRLTSITIPSSVSYIGYDAFWDSGLSTVIIHAKKISIDDDAFKGSHPTFFTYQDSDVYKWAKNRKYDVVDISEGALSETSLEMEYGDTYSLTVCAPDGYSATWSSSNSKVATVKDGTVTAIGGGTCTITATLNNGKALECAVTVTDPAELSETELSMEVGSTDELEVYDLGNRTVTWSSSDGKVAMVKGGTVTAIGEGSCTIYATLSNGKVLECEVSVDDHCALYEYESTYWDDDDYSEDGTEIHSARLNVSETLRLTVIYKGDRSVTWSSSDDKVATVKAGTVTAIREGSCTITATLSNGKALNCVLTVKDPAKLSKAELSMNIGEKYALKVSDLGNRTVTWSSSDTSIATVKAGTVTAIGEGTCTITATLSNGQTFKCKVTVKDAARFTETKLSLKPGESQTLRISGLYGREVAWTSSDEKIATVKNGTVTAVYIGSCTVTGQIKNGKKLTCTVTVTDAVALSNDKLTISNIDTDRITLTGGLNRKVTWSTSNKNVVEITGSDNDSASIKAVKNGAATITAKVEGGKTLKCVVKVVDPLTIELDEIDEESIYNKVWVYFNNHSNKKITYVTLDIAQYNNRGDKLESPYSYFYLNETVAPHDSLHHYYWVNDDTKKVRITITEVTFADKTTWRP